MVCHRITGSMSAVALEQLLGNLAKSHASMASNRPLLCQPPISSAQMMEISWQWLQYPAAAPRSARHRLHQRHLQWLHGRLTAKVLPMGRHVWQFARPGILDHQHNSCARTEKFWVWNPAAFHSLVSSPERFWLVSTRRLAVERPQGALANDNASLRMKGWVIRG